MSYTCYGIYFSRTYLVNTVFYRKHNFFNYCDVSSLLKMPLSYIQIWILKQWSVVAFDTFFSLKNSKLKCICFTSHLIALELFDRFQEKREITSGKIRLLKCKYLWNGFEANLMLCINFILLFKICTRHFDITTLNEIGYGTG